MLRWVDGFDWMDCGANGSPFMKYPGSLAPFAQVAAAPGRYGQGSLDLLNSGFDQMNFSRDVPVNTTWYSGFAMRPMRGFSNFVVFFRLEHNNAAGTVIALRVNPSHQVELMKGGSGTNSFPGTIVADVATPILALNTTVYWEVGVAQAGALSSVKIFADDVLVLDLGPPLDGEGSGADGAIDLSAYGSINRVTFRWEALGNGYRIDDYYIGDNTGPVNNTRLGPIQIVSSIPAADVITNLTRNAGSTDAGCVSELPWSPGVSTFGAPDGDNTYLSPPLGNEFDLWTISPFTCIAKILGLALNANWKALTSDQIDFLHKSGAIQTTIASKSPAANNTYEVLQAIQELSINTGLTWVDGELNDDYWGAALSAGHLTQFVLEKILTLRSVAYTCGSSPTTGMSYAF